ncbi:hypothetical protein FQR65_LT14348 [Abscondita terminalis]|nr:hypothetical protein FQR65_LT14348 [Abscondita terminalis]
MTTQRIDLSKNSPTMFNSWLGWVWLSPISLKSFDIRCHFAETIELQQQLSRFWELEEIARPKPPMMNNSIGFIEFERFSSFIRLQRTVAYVLRFLENCKNSKNQRKLTHLDTSEVSKALLLIIILIQNNYFEEGIKCLESNCEISPNSRILSLTPFLDTNKILGVEGRLENSDLNFDAKHPILLPASHHVVHLIFKHEYVKLGRHYVQMFWRRWKFEYLATLIPKSNLLKPGMMVIIADNNLSTMQWLLGRIVEVRPGQDGTVRAATVSTCRGNTKTAVTKLFLLLIEQTSFKRASSDSASLEEEEAQDSFV